MREAGAEADRRRVGGRRKSRDGLVLTSGGAAMSRGREMTHQAGGVDKLAGIPSVVRRTGHRFSIYPKPKLISVHLCTFKLPIVDTVCGIFCPSQTNLFPQFQSIAIFSQPQRNGKWVT